MHRRLIATIAAAAIAITAIGAAPARADDRDVARVLAAILGVAVVGKIIHDRNKDKHQPERVTRHKPQQPVYQAPRRHVPYAQPVTPRALPKRVNRKLLPQQCFRTIQTYQGPVRMFGQRCLNRHYRFVHALPQFCQHRLRTDRGVRIGYEARCLRNQGYRLARR